MRALLSIVVLAGITLASSLPAWAGAPTDELRRHTDRVVEILKSPRLGPAERRAAVRDLALDVFDVAETARRALGPHWQRRTPAEREEFVGLFRDLLEQSYVSRIDEYGGERVEYVAKAGTAVPVESRLARKAGRWLIYDILIENVSLVGNYRAQFDRVIRTSSYEELVKRLKERGAPPGGKPPAAAPR
jgi:phospholipid transport system substrate-binding protein